MALTFIWGGLWIGYWIVDIGGWYVSVWTMCILSVGWTCCQPKRWLSSPCGGARAGGRPRRGSKSTWCLPPASISGLAPASSLGRSSPQPRPASTLYLLPGHRHLRLASPHCHTSTLLFQILLWQWSHRTPRHCTLTPGKSSGNATNELHSVRYAAEYIQRSNQLHLPEKQKFPLCMNV